MFARSKVKLKYLYSSTPVLISNITFGRSPYYLCAVTHQITLQQEFEFFNFPFNFPTECWANCLLAEEIIWKIILLNLLLIHRVQLLNTLVLPFCPLVWRSCTGLHGFEYFINYKQGHKACLYDLPILKHDFCETSIVEKNITWEFFFFF